MACLLITRVSELPRSDAACGGLWHAVNLRCVLQGRQICVSADAPIVFHPSGSVIQMFDIYEGSLHKLLRGHMDTVNACYYNPTTQVRPEQIVLHCCSKTSYCLRYHSGVHLNWAVLGCCL